MGITEKLGRFAAETPFSAVPPAAIELSKLRCLDILGVMVKVRDQHGWREPA